MSLLRDHFDQSRSPLDLAITRVVVFAILGWLCVRESPVWMAGLPRDLLDPPPLTAWLTTFMDPGAVRVAQVVTILAAIAATLGIGYGISAPVAVLGALYVLGVPQVWGKVNHYHHIVWFAAILAVSPATDALAPGRRTLPQPSPAYGQPLAFIGLLLGLAYFFPGVAKARLGLQWIWSDNLKYLMYQKWFELPGFTPLFRLDDYPLALRFLAASVVLFELSFVWLILHRRTRPFAVLGGLAFHTGTALFMGINFKTLWPCYVAFVPWGRFVAHAGEPSPARIGPALTGCLCITGAALAALLHINSWPFAYYPTFARVAGPTVTLAQAENLDPAVEHRIVARMSATRWFSILRRAATDPDPAVRQRTSRGILSLLQRESPGHEAPRLSIVSRNVVPRRAAE